MHLRYLYFVALLKIAKNTEQTIESTTTIVKAGTDFIIKCYTCTIDQLTVTYKAPNAGHEVIKLAGKAMTKKKIHDRINFLYDLVIDDCEYHLLLSEVQFDSAGLFSCWEGSVETKRINLIVISRENNCLAIPESSKNGNIHLKRNDSITIICPFQYSADELCIVKPIWTDLTGYRNLTVPCDDFEVNMDDKHAWISFRQDADITNGTHFDLHFLFGCSYFSNYSQGHLHIRQYRTHHFGEVPFMLILEYKAGSNSELENKKTSAFFNALIMGLIATFIAALLVAATIAFCSASKKAVNSNKFEMSLHIGMEKHVTSKEIKKLDVLNEDLYEVINESPASRTYEKFTSTRFKSLF